MADAALDRRTVLDGRQFTSPADRKVRLSPVAAMTRLSLRGRPGIESAVSPVLGLTLPTVACSAVTAAEFTALWLGPDEWLLLAPDGRAASLIDELEAATSQVPHAITDISHRQVALEVSGPEAAFVINHGCPLDLDLAAFPVGMATRTLLGRTEVVLWRKAPTLFHVECWRSFADYLVDFLEEARREFRS